MLRKVTDHLVPSGARRWWRRALPFPFDVRGGTRLEPVSNVFGLDRGQPIDRYYIEGFLSQSRSLIRGRVLEIADNAYTLRFASSRTVDSQVLHATEGNPSATIVGDLASGHNLSSNSFDCVILTQTLPFIYDVKSAVNTVARILRPGGTVLATVPGISQISRYDMDRWGDFWRFTDLSMSRLFTEAFPSGAVEVEAKGNVVVAAALLQGLAVEELSRRELDFCDPDYQVIITVKAVKARDMS